MNKTTQIVKASGTRYECGHQHGEQAAEEIKYNLKYYFGWWERNLKMSKDEVYEYIDNVLDATKAYDSGLVEEMRGIADAVEVDLEAVAALNGRYELAWASPEQLMGGCTCIAALPIRTESRNTLLAQNWDYRVDVQDTCIILKVKVDDGPSVVMHTEAGIIGHKGLNSEGIGIVLNAMVSDRDKLGESVPFFLVCRKMLDSPRFSEATKELLNAERNLSYNVMMAGKGIAVSLEAHPEDVSIIYPEYGVLAHTNHFVGDRALQIKDKFVLSETSSINRYIMAKNKLNTHDAHSFESFKEMLTDHYDHPTSICHHPDKSKHRDHWEETVSSVYMEPERLLFMYTAGPPCSNQYTQVAL